MSRSITINNGYYSLEQKRGFPLNCKKDYSYQISFSTGGKLTIESNCKMLLPELDIFSLLPSGIYDNNHIKNFLHELKESLLDVDINTLRDITLPKLKTGSVGESSIVIEWIFNYFRFYFLFDRKEGDFYGMVINDPEKGKFINISNKLYPEKYREVARANIDNAISMAKGVYE